MKSNILKLCIGLILLAGMLSCDDGLSTLFTTIQNDTKISDSGLENNISVLDMGLVTIGPDQYYYIACGNVRRRPVTGNGSDWGSVSTGANGIANTLATNGTVIYAGVVNDNAVGTVRYFNGTIWDVTPTALPADFKQAVNIKYNSGSGQFYISYLKDDNTYSITNGGFVDQGYSFPTPVTDMVDDNNFVTGGSVYLNGSAVATLPGTGYTYSAIFDFGGYIYVGTRNGTIHRTNDDGATWETLGSYTSPLGSRPKVKFTTFAQANADHLFVGTANYGFYELDATAFTAKHFSDSSKPDLYNGSIECFYRNNETVFIGSMGHGLWRNTYSAATATWGDTWRLE